MDLLFEIGNHKICISYDGRYYVYFGDGNTITPDGLSLADALIFIGAHMKRWQEETAI